MKSILTVTMCLAVLQSACVHRNNSSAPLQKPTIATQHYFNELEAGWTIRVVVPMLRSGGYVLPSLKTEAVGNTVEIKTGDDLLGYEKAYYKTSSRSGGGIRIRFSHSEVWQNGKTHTRHEPLLDLFQEAESARHVRLVYLIRESGADHDMAIVSSDDPAALDQTTQAVIRYGECRSFQNASCRWVPPGIAVARETPERNIKNTRAR